ncbi:Pterin-4-alpha-carbinolamine dehydratase 2 protein [Thalictrum thalictroides]|uniref:4a-hydroxytetrahydrobiopterin dehydratase n=1 Tax=Thalictrum thalictroides TaxID=46969 RepID=A0A7J6W3J0_THATH|nr:Pterin-4-alpha-carbinolamine dehydratase 2 protein [Thalictrum thalictroides]
MNRMLKTCFLSSSSSSFKTPLFSFFNIQFRAHGRSSIQATDILQDHVKVSSNRNSFPGFRTYCTEKDLSIKKCVPCDSKDIRPMTEEAAHSLTPKVPGWDLVKDGDILKLNRSWKVKSFTKGLDLFQVIAEVAEAEGHHPDLHLVGWNNVKIEIWTHSVSGLTENDFILASKINALDVQHLLRRKATN